MKYLGEDTKYDLNKELNEVIQIYHGSLWHSIIFSRYGQDVNGWDCNQNLPRAQSLCWQHITQMSHLFYPNTRFLLENGLRIRFWKDLWWGDTTLALVFPKVQNVGVGGNIGRAKIGHQKCRKYRKEIL